MKPLDFPLLTDENIAADVVAGIRAPGCDVRSADEERLIGQADGEVLERATVLHRVVVTHDLAFGKVEIRGGTSFVGIIYLRSGHISAAPVSAWRSPGTRTREPCPIRFLRSINRLTREGLSAAFRCAVNTLRAGTALETPAGGEAA